MKAFDIYKLESNNINCCYLIKDGIFWRAWEKSSMLFCKNIKEYQLKCKHFKGINATLVFIGFPGKYLETIKEKCKAAGYCMKQDDNLITITGFSEIDGFNDWKAKVRNDIYASDLPEITEESKSDNDHFIDLIKDKITGFPLASKTPMECQQFIYELQKLINGTI